MYILNYFLKNILKKLISFEEWSTPKPSNQVKRKLEEDNGIKNENNYNTIDSDDSDRSKQARL